MRHDRGLDASPPVCCILEVERSGYTSFHLPSAVDGQPPRKAAAYGGTQTPRNRSAPPSKLITLLKQLICFRVPTRLAKQSMCDQNSRQNRVGQRPNRPRLRGIRLTYAVLSRVTDGLEPAPPSEPQSADSCFWALPYVAQSAYLGQFCCSQLHVISTYCVLGGVRSGVNDPPSFTTRRAPRVIHRASAIEIGPHETLQQTPPPGPAYQEYPDRRCRADDHRVQRLNRTQIEYPRQGWHDRDR